jgi:hypothetical protein
VKFGGDVFGDKDNLGGTANELGLLGLGLGNDEGEDGTAIRRGDGDPAVARLKAGVEGQMEAELVKVEAQAAILIADVDVHAVKSEVEVRAGE